MLQYRSLHHGSALSPAAHCRMENVCKVERGKKTGVRGTGMGLNIFGRHI